MPVKTCLFACLFHNLEIVVDLYLWIRAKLSVWHDLVATDVVTQFSTILADILQGIPNTQEVVQRVSEEGRCVAMYVLC